MELEQRGVDVSHIVVDEQMPGGHAVIQVDAHGENSIVLFPGCNHNISKSQIEAVLENFKPGDFLLLQNEISEIPYLIREGSRNELQVCFNPAQLPLEYWSTSPCTSRVYCSSTSRRPRC